MKSTIPDVAKTGPGWIWKVLCLSMALWGDRPACVHAQQDDLPGKSDLVELAIPSSLDGTVQASRFWSPSDRGERRPLLVFLHSWSGDYRQDNSAWLRLAAQRGWIFLHPNFRGRNDHPEACGSRLARQDILDALDHVLDHNDVDPNRIYLAGASGGGHMAMLMSARHPERFSAVSAWVGISDLADWYEFHSDRENGKPSRYAKMILSSLKGAPGTNASIDAEYRDRSSIHFLGAIEDLPLDLSAGLQDGHSGSVPIRHSLRAYNVIATAHGNPLISAEEIQQLSSAQPLKRPQPGDESFDPSFQRRIYLRRQSRGCRISIFEGGHEAIPAAGIAFLEKHLRLTRRSVKQVDRNP